MRKIAAGVSAIVATCTLLACGGDPKSPTKQAGPAHDKISTSADRTDVGITVYTDDFGLVRETRNLSIGEGRVALEVRDVAASIQPETVNIKPAKAGALRVLEQNYRYDLLTPQKLLEKYEGKDVNVIRYNKETGKDETFAATVLSTKGGEPIFKIGNEITYGFPGRISFPNVPANLISKPTLVWLLDSGQAQQKAEITYLTGKIGWAADYVLTLGADEKSADLTGWVTLRNHSGASYENAKLKLVAGDVQKIRARDEERGYGGKDLDALAEDDKQEQFKEEGFFEYHLYTLDRPTTLLDNEDKQVVLLEGHGIHTDKRLIFFGQQNYYRGSYGQVTSNQKVGVFLDIENKEANHLGIPLPKGVVRVYKADASGAKQFIGEDAIDHTPRDEKLRIKMGESFDVVGDRSETTWKTLGTCRSQSDWEITLKNHKDTDQVVQDIEPVGGDWEILKSSHPYVKQDAHTFTFTVNVPARKEIKITYRVLVSWC